MASRGQIKGPDAWLVELWLDFGAKVRELRQEKGWTQADLAAQLKEFGIDMHQTTVAKLEGGTRPTAVHEIWALAKLLDASYEDLLPPVEPMEDADDFAAAMRRYERLEAVAAAAEREAARATKDAKRALQDVERLREATRRAATGHLHLEGRPGPAKEGE